MNNQLQLDAIFNKLNCVMPPCEAITGSLSGILLASTTTPATKRPYRNYTTYSHYGDPLDERSERLSGYSRNHGDASSQVQMQVMKKILEASDTLSTDDRALLLAIVRLESGFNPDAAATTTSASGLFQFINSTGKAYGINDSNRFDADAQIQAGIRLFQDNVKLLEKRSPGLSGKERAAKLYALHHDGPSLKYGGEDLARKGIVPYLDRFSAVVDAFIAEARPRQ